MSSTTERTAAVAHSNNNASGMSLESEEGRILIVRKHYERKGYRVHSGLQFGCELVLYADDPSRVHSDFCVHVVPKSGLLDWRMMQTLVRSMPDLHKTLLLARPMKRVNSSSNNDNDDDDEDEQYHVDEIAIATEHAPFRHKKQAQQQSAARAGQQHQVGTQVKKKPRVTENHNAN